MDTPFGTQLIRSLNPEPNELGPNKIRSKRKCSLGNAFVGHGWGGGMRPWFWLVLRFGGAYWPLALAHPDPLWVRTCFGSVNGAPG